MLSQFSTLTRLLPLALLAVGQAAIAQGAKGFPERPVKFVVGYSPGGLPDTIGRLLGHKLSERWGQQIVVENRAGANAILGAEFVVKSAPDGYTLLMTDNSTTAINPFLYSKLSYSADDLVPVSLTARAPLFLAVHPSTGVNSFQELIALAKSKPGQLSYGSSGIGSIHHLGMEYLSLSLGLKLLHVPYKGTGQSVPALLAGQVPMILSGYPTVGPQAKEGRIKLVANTSLKRSELAPNVPTIAETIPGYDFAPTFGLFAPKGTPQEVIAKIGADAAEVVKQPEVLARMRSLGIDPVGLSGRDWAPLLRSDSERFSKAVKASGAKAD
jgi:tripartite-type tricarboxylate transporter receptor subunit TctC